MDIVLRPVTEEEVPAFKQATAIAFGSLASDEADIYLAGLPLDRTIAAFDGDVIVGTAAAHSFELTVPGGALVPTAGVTSVGVRPTHRRRGLLVRMMEEQLADVASRGEPLAMLIASESVIYGRFGYGLATYLTRWTLPTEGTELAGAREVDGRFRLLEAYEAASVVPRLYDAARRRYVGEVTRAAEWWAYIFSEEQTKKHPRFTVVHETPEGEPDGFARYRVRDDWSGGIARNSVEVADLYALDFDVEAALWQFLVDIDLVATVKSDGRPLDDPVRWRLANPRRMQVSQVTDSIWVRIVDPAAALGARSYATDDRIVVELTDSFLPGNEGRWAIEPGSASRTTDDPDLALSATELGSLYLGGVSASTLARAARIAELVPGALARADRMFTISPAPWCRTDF
jgi:predicted acetyltransferase